MHPHDTQHRRVCRSQHGLGAGRASPGATLAAWGAVFALAASPAAQACGYHDPASAGVGMLNWAYPDSLHVRTAVWMAQASGVLPRREPLPDVDPLSVTFRFQQSIRLRDTQARLGELRHRVDAALAGQPMPAFAMVLIGPMLWTRFEAADGGVRMVSHAQGPAPDDVVVVSDAPVLAALVDGSITFRSARERGLARLYGPPDAVEHLSSILERPTPPHPARLSHLVDPVQKD